MKEKFYPKVDFADASQYWNEVINTRLRDVNSFKISIYNIYLFSSLMKNCLHNFKKTKGEFIKINEVLNTFDSLSIIGSTNTSIPITIFSLRLFVLPITAVFE